MNQESPEKRQLTSKQMEALLLKYSLGAELKCPMCEVGLDWWIVDGPLFFVQKTGGLVLEWLCVDCVNGHRGRTVIKN